MINANILSYSIWISLMIFLYIRYLNVLNRWEHIKKVAHKYDCKYKNELPRTIYLQNRYVSTFSIWDWGYESIIKDADIYEKLKKYL